MFIQWWRFKIIMMIFIFFLKLSVFYLFFLDIVNNVNNVFKQKEIANQILSKILKSLFAMKKLFSYFSHQKNHKPDLHQLTIMMIIMMMNSNNLRLRPFTFSHENIKHAFQNLFSNIFYMR